MLAVARRRWAQKTNTDQSVSAARSPTLERKSTERSQKQLQYGCPCREDKRFRRWKTSMLDLKLLAAATVSFCSATALSAVPASDHSCRMPEQLPCISFRCSACGPVSCSCQIASNAEKCWAQTGLMAAVTVNAPAQTDDAPASPTATPHRGRQRGVPGATGGGLVVPDARSMPDGELETVASCVDPRSGHRISSYGCQTSASLGWARAVK
jgi:hypothetical protein